MPKKSKSTQLGVLSGETTENPQASPSTNGESPSTLGTLGITVPPSHNSQVTENSESYGRMVQMFGKKLVELGVVRWHKATAKGQKGWVMWFPAEKWRLDPDTNELVPK